MESIPRVSPTGVALWWERRPAAASLPSPVRRPVAHVLTLLGFTADGPTYAFECRADAGDLGKTCATWTICECEPKKPTKDNPPDEEAPCPQSPTGRHEWRDGFCWRPARGCAYAYADAEETDAAIRKVIDDNRLTRGVYFVDVKRSLTSAAFDIEMELLARMTSMVGWLSPDPITLTVRPTQATRYPGYGPEVDLRELIEESLTDDPHALQWDDDQTTVIVDAAEAAKKVVAWIEQTYDVPSDQLSFTALPPRVREPDNTRRHGMISPPIREGVL